MRSKVLFALLLITAFVFAGCASQPESSGSSPQDAAQAQANAQDALRRMDDALAGKPSAPAASAPKAPAASAPAPSAPASAPAQVTSGGKEPAWVTDPYAAYSRDKYVAVVGFAANRGEAEKKAFGNLAAYFGQSVDADFSAVEMYSEAASKGIVVSSSSTVNVRDAVSLKASLDNLIGAQIGNIWDNAKGIVYTVAYIEKEKAVAAYSDIIAANNKNISTLTTMTPAQKNTFDGYSRYKLASAIARINTKYASIVYQCGGPSADALKVQSVDSLNIEASNILKAITVLINVKGDQNNRIRDAFAKALSAEGLRTQGSGPYTLRVTLSMEEAVFPGNKNKFCSFTVSAELVENATNSVLVPISFTDRAGHQTYERAQAVALQQSEKIIAEKFPPAFKQYIDSLLPKK